MKFLPALGQSVDMPHHVSYGETDTMGVVYYAEYLHIAERARNFLSRSVNFKYTQMEEAGLFLPVREAEIRYRVPMRYDELVYVRTGICEIKKASLCYCYTFLDEAKTKVLAEASTLHACIQKDGKVKPLPKNFIDALGIFLTK